MLKNSQGIWENEELLGMGIPLYKMPTWYLTGTHQIPPSIRHKTKKKIECSLYTLGKAPTLIRLKLASPCTSSYSRKPIALGFYPTLLTPQSWKMLTLISLHVQTLLPHVLLLVQGCNWQWHVQRCYGDLKVGCHLFLETGSIMSIVPSVSPYDYEFQTRGFTEHGVRGQRSTSIYLSSFVLISMYEATTKHLFILRTRKLLHMTGQGSLATILRVSFH